MEPNPPQPDAAPSANAPPAAATGMPASPVLEMIAVAIPSLKRPSHIVLADVNWSVAPGDFWAVGGLQGSGKSDFIAVAAGILPPASGTFKAFGRELRTGFEHERVATQLRLGMVFNGGQLLHHLSLAENIALPLRYHRNCRMQDCAEPLQALLEFTELSAWAEEYPGNLTSGRQQRAGLARALALQPDVLLLDNPLSGLDPQDAAWWLAVLDRLFAGHPIRNGRPLTLVVTTDDLRPWRDHARQFAVLRQQRLEPVSSAP